MTSERKCGECKGTGIAEYIGGYARPCEACYGEGYIATPKPDAKGEEALVVLQESIARGLLDGGLLRRAKAAIEQLELTALEPLVRPPRLRRIDQSMMLGSELKDARLALSMSYGQLATRLRLGGNGARHLREMEGGSRPISGPISVAVELLIERQARRPTLTVLEPDPLRHVEPRI